SLFRYAVECLGLSEAVAYNAIAVARKATEVPALREAVHAGALGLSKATKVVSVLTAGQAPAVQKDWVEKAIELSSRQLEKKVATENPKLCTPERAVYRSAKRLDLRL